MTAERKPSEIADMERAFQMLESAGVPRERARSVSNGIMVLMQRYDREIAALRSAAPPRGEPVAQHTHDFDCVTAIFNQMKDACPEGIRHEDGWILIPHDAAPSDRDREDAERLDFLDRTNAPFKMGWSVGTAPAGNVSVQAVIQLGREITPIRAAIDAAIASAKGGDRDNRS